MLAASKIISGFSVLKRQDADLGAIMPGMILAAFLCLSVILFRPAVVAATPLEVNQGLQVTLILLGMIPASGAVFYCMPGWYRPRMASLYFTVALGHWSAMAFGDLGHLISYLSKDLPFWDHLLAGGDAILGFD